MSTTNNVEYHWPRTFNNASSSPESPKRGSEAKGDTLVYHMTASMQALHPTRDGIVESYMGWCGIGKASCSVGDRGGVRTQSSRPNATMNLWPEIGASDKS